MDIIIIVLAVLGFSSIIIAAYVVTSATRKDKVDRDGHEKRDPTREQTLDRRRYDRRSGEPSPRFPLTVNGTVITEDRRRRPDRRMDLAA